MARAIRAVSTERGRDVRKFALFASIAADGCGSRGGAWDPAAVAPLRRATPDAMADDALRRDARVLVSTYNEPLITAEWAVEIFLEAGLAPHRVRVERQRHAPGARLSPALGAAHPARHRCQVAGTSRTRISSPPPPSFRSGRL